MFFEVLKFYVFSRNFMFFLGHLYQNSLCYSLLLFRSSHRSCSLKIGVLKSFAKFTGKHLCQCLFFNKVAGLRPATLFKKTLGKNTFFAERFRVTASDFLQYDEVCSISLLVRCYHHLVFMDPVNDYLKSKLLVKQQVSLKSKTKFGYVCFF